MDNAFRESDYKQLTESTLAQEASERYTDTLSSAIDDSVSFKERNSALHCPQSESSSNHGQLSSTTRAASQRADNTNVFSIMIRSLLTLDVIRSHVANGFQLTPSRI